MSHVTTIDLEIKDLDALAKAAESIGLELLKGVNRYRWFSGGTYGDITDQRLREMGISENEVGVCDHVLRVKDAMGAYEIGVKEVNGTGTYRLLYDPFGGGNGLMERVSFQGEEGEDLGRLAQAYSTEVTERSLRRQGFRVVRKAEGNKVRLVATR